MFQLFIYFMRNSLRYNELIMIVKMTGTIIISMDGSGAIYLGITFKLDQIQESLVKREINRP